MFAEGNSTMNFNMTGCSVERFTGLMAGVEVGSNGTSAVMNYNVNNNSKMESAGEVAFLASTFNTSDLNGRTNNNTNITNTINEESTFSNIRVLHEGNGQAIIEVKNNPNVFSNNLDIPVNFVAINGSNAAARLDATLSNNAIINTITDVTAPIATGFEGIVLQVGANVGGSAVNTLCGNIVANALNLPATVARAFAHNPKAGWGAVNHDIFVNVVSLLK